MTTIKSYTDLDQSKKLAEILPLESADMHYNNVSIKGINYVDEHRADLMEYNRAIEVLSKCTINPLFKVIPCWSVGALIELMPSGVRISKNCDGNYDLGYRNFDTKEYLYMIDACYEMIIKLHELKML